MNGSEDIECPQWRYDAENKAAEALEKLVLEPKDHKNLELSVGGRTCSFISWHYPPGNALADKRVFGRTRREFIVLEHKLPYKLFRYHMMSSVVVTCKVRF